jgi:hypothetical protein
VLLRKPFCVCRPPSSSRPSATQPLLLVYPHRKPVAQYANYFLWIRYDQKFGRLFLIIWFTLVSSTAPLAGGFFDVLFFKRILRCLLNKVLKSPSDGKPWPPVL